jgi:hypothetical protein
MNSSVLGSGGILDPDGAMEQMRAWKGRIDRLAADTQAMSAALQELRVTVSDDDGLAEVTIDSSGILVDLRLGAKVQRTAPEVTARAIMDTVRKARAQLADRSKEIITDTMGADSEVGRGIAERVSQQLRANDDAGAPDSGDEPDAYGWRRRR